MVPRKRKPGQEWLENYSGLYINRNGTFYVKHPVTGRQGSLDTKSASVAVKRWSILSQRWSAEQSDHITDRLASRLEDLTIPKTEFKYLSDYLQHWRTNVLGHSVDSFGSVSWGACHVISQRGKNKGSEIAHQTKIDYANDCKQLELSTDSQFPLTDRQIITKIRVLLKPWIQKPTHYNGLRNTLSRIFDHAIMEGVIEVNPVKDIKKVIEPKREVHIPDEHYVAITEKLMVHQLNKREFNGEWRARVCDMIYMMSQQPIDVFGLKEEQLFDSGEFGELHLARHKTGNQIIIEMNEELSSLIAWFREFKREQGIISPYLMVYPIYFDRRSRGQPIRHRFIQAAWAEAAKEAGFDGVYQLRDLRKKGLTDEFLSQGDNDKGGHDTEAMKNHYRLVKPPKRAKNTLKSLRG